MRRPITLKGSTADTRPLRICDRCKRQREQAGGVVQGLRFLCSECVYRRATGSRSPAIRGHDSNPPNHADWLAAYERVEAQEWPAK